MSETRIIGGDGYAMLVTENGFGKVQSVSEQIRDHACTTGIEQKYNINTLDITLSNDTETSLLYVQNGNSTYDLVCSIFIYQNTGSTRVLQGKFYKGASGETAFTDGDVTVSTRSASHTGRIAINLGNYTVAPGTAVGVNYLPPTGNTSQIVEVAMACYLKTNKVGI
jgi:hypothetical protein